MSTHSIYLLYICSTSAVFSTLECKVCMNAAASLAMACPRHRDSVRLMAKAARVELYRPITGLVEPVMEQALENCPFDSRSATRLPLSEQRGIHSMSILASMAAANRWMANTVV